MMPPEFYRQRSCWPTQERHRTSQSGGQDLWWWCRRKGSTNYYWEQRSNQMSLAPLANGASNGTKNHRVRKDAYEKEVADIKEKRSNVVSSGTDSRCNNTHVDETWFWWDDGIGDGAKAWKLLQVRFQCGDRQWWLWCHSWLDCSQLCHQRKRLQNFHKSRRAKVRTAQTEGTK